MKKIIVFAMLLAIAGCAKNNVQPECKSRATVKDLSGLDGCGFVFELEDGTRLEPIIRVYVTAPTNDPLYGFEFVDGKKVTIDYEISSGASACMAGPIVNITCLTEVRSNSL